MWWVASKRNSPPHLDERAAHATGGTGRSDGAGIHREIAGENDVDVRALGEQIGERIIAIVVLIKTDALRLDAGRGAEIHVRSDDVELAAAADDEAGIAGRNRTGGTVGGE